MIKMILKDNRDYIIIFLISIIVHHINYGLQTLNPENINWLMSAYHDWGQHYLGWAFFKEESWSFPLGNIQNYNYPDGSNVGFTDSIPLFAIFFKFFSFMLPNEFQYFGIWFLICFYLTGLYTYKIIKLYTNSNVLILISILFLLFNPVLLYRGMHPALCSHWLIIASIYNYLKITSLENVKSINKNQSLLLILSALINPYIFLMVLGFNFIIPVKNILYDKINIEIKKIILYPLISIITVFLIWIIIGMISFNNKGLEVVDSYGLYAFNLNNFYNPSAYSKFLPELKWQNHHQYEGFAYFGLGILSLLVFTPILFFLKRKNYINKSKFLPLFILVFLTIIFSLTNKLSFGENIIYEYPTLDFIKKIGNIFRASGRFIWVLYYVIYFFVIIIFLTSNLTKKIKYLVMIFLFCIQIYDISLLITFRNLSNGKYELVKYDKEWFSILPKFNKIITYPSFQFDLLTTMDYQDLCYMALRNNMPITCGYVAREKGDLNLKFSQKLSSDLNEGLIDTNNIYVTTKNNLEDFYPSIHKNNLSIKFLNGYYLIFDTKKVENIEQHLVDKNVTDSIKTVISKKLKIDVVKNTQFSFDKIKYYIEQINDSENIQVKGWAFLKETSNNLNDSIFVLLTNKDKTYLSKTRLEIRTDITNTYKQGNLDLSGFRTTIFKNNITPGIYDLAIGIKKNNSKIIYEKTDPLTQIKIGVSLKVDKINNLQQFLKKGKGNIDLLEVKNNKINLRGWATILKQKREINDDLKILLIGNKTAYSIQTNSEIRKDITSSIGDGFNYDNSGFNLIINKNRIERGNYKIYILLDSKKNIVFNTNRTIKI